MEILYISVTILILSLIILLLAYKESRKYKTSTREELGGIMKAVLDRTLRKQSNLDETLSLFSERESITNSDARKALEVSSRTAVRYLDELERQGKIIQIGKTGQSVTYRKAS